MDQRREFTLHALGTLCQRASLAWVEPVVGVVGGAGDRFGTRSPRNGKLSWKQQKVFLSGNLAGWEVGLQRAEKGQLEVWFGRLLLGHLDPVD